MKRTNLVEGMIAIDLEVFRPTTPLILTNLPYLQEDTMMMMEMATPILQGQAPVMSKFFGA